MQNSDSLSELAKKYAQAVGASVPEETKIDEPKPSDENEVSKLVDDSTSDFSPFDEVDDIIKKEDAAAELERNTLIQAQKTNVETTMPPDEYDMEYHKEAIQFQADKLTIVANMIDKVVKKNNITSGHIDPKKIDQIRGDLIEYYELHGEEITPEFENIILSNIVYNNEDNTNDQKEDTSSAVDIVESAGINTDNNAKINIEVHDTNAPISINIDESVVAELSETKQVDIVVKEISNDVLLSSSNIITNSNRDDIITPYDAGINDVPVTLPNSAYRCVFRPINFFDFIKLAAPSSQNQSDVELQRWSVLYRHIKNPSIGNFESFEDFLKNTKYADRELMMWAILVATADEEETLSFPCPNDKCDANIIYKYSPRQICHVDESKVDKSYFDIHDVSTGIEAIKLRDKLNSTSKRYQLPHSKVIVELELPSAYQHLYEKLPIITSLVDRYHTDKSKPFDYKDPKYFEFDYLTMHALMISSMSIVKDGKEYRFTNWEDIERIITISIDGYDSSVLTKLIETVRSDTSPVSFYIEDVLCPKCGQRRSKMIIEDIGGSLLFQVSRRFSNTTINLIKTPSN